MSGRPRKPHKLRVLEGGRGKSRALTPDLPAPTSPLSAPTALAADERAAWKKHQGWLRKLGLESAVDSGAVEAMVRLYCRARRADKVIAKEGLTFESEANGVVKRPEVSISRESWRDYVALCGQFGLTPAARAKLGAGGKAPEEAGDVPPELRDASGGA